MMSSPWLIIARLYDHGFRFVVDGGQLWYMVVWSMVIDVYMVNASISMVLQLFKLARADKSIVVLLFAIINMVVDDRYGS